MTARRLTPGKPRPASLKGKQLPQRPRRFAEVGTKDRDGSATGICFRSSAFLCDLGGRCSSSFPVSSFFRRFVLSHFRDPFPPSCRRGNRENPKERKRESITEFQPADLP